MVKILRPGYAGDILSAKMDIQKEDVLHTRNLIEYMHDWLEDKGWGDLYEVKVDDKFEHYYHEKRHQNGDREMRMWWRVQMKPLNSSYYRYVMLINMRNIYGKKVEIVHQGQKFSTFRGDMNILIEAWLQLDYKDQWRNHWLMKHIDYWFRKRLYKPQVDSHKKDLWREAYEFAGFVKQYLNMKNPFEQPEAFHPAMQGHEPVVPPTGRKAEHITDHKPKRKDFWWGD